MDATVPRTPSRLPILIANGFAPFPLPLQVVREQYRARGYATRVVPFRLADMADVERYAAHIAAEAKSLMREKRCDRVHLIGYSMGGVAGLYAIKRLGLAEHVEAFAGLGSPFHGSRFSWFAIPSGLFSLMGSQLVPRSPFLKRLHEDPLPLGPRYLTVAGTRDAVCPPATARLDGAHFRELPIGHAQFLVDERVPDLVVPHLR